MTVADCILWESGTSGGYGIKNVQRPDGRWVPVRAHRLAYEAEHGPIPAGFHVHHRCEVRLCVNAAHLELLTNSEHHARHHEPPTHCKHGHEFTPENTYIRRDGQGRVCRRCRNDRLSAFRGRVAA